MKRKTPTILILMVMVLLGALRWVDLSYYTDPATGFSPRGSEWVRYAVLILPLVMTLLGLRTVGPRGIAVLRLKNPALGGLFAGAGAIGVVAGAARLVVSITGFSVLGIVWGLFTIWYGVWMVLCGVQLFTQHAASPTQSAVPGVLAALPFCVQAVYRVLVNPSSLWRTGTLIYAFSALLLMLWFGMLLRALYIAMPQRRVKWLYFFGVFSFLFATCLELPQTIWVALFAGGSGFSVVESIGNAALGLVAGCLSVSVAGQSDAPEDQRDLKPVR